MSLVSRIKDLSSQKGVTFAEIERNISISNGQIRRWDTVSPKSETLQKVAIYFNVSMDYLLERTDNTSLSYKQEDSEYDDLIVMFRKNEMDIPQDERAHYRQEVAKLMEFVKFTMKDLDQKNKNK